MREHLAIVKRDDVAALQSALDADLTVDARFRFRTVSLDSMVSQGASLLCASAYFASVSCFRFLLARSADSTATDDCGRHVTHFTCAGGSFEILMLLMLDDVPWTLADISGNTCLHYAVAFRRRKVLFSLWVNCQIDLTTRNNRGMSALHIAAATGQADLIEFLVRNGCEVNDRDTTGQTSLHLAAAGTDLRLIHKLVECGADVTIRDNSGCLPVDRTSRCGNVYVCRFLIECTPNKSLRKDPVDGRVRRQ
jgi:ankyrin repeat protein